jgi:hypothetical protein
MFGQAMRPQLRGHCDARFADAVVAAVDRGLGCAYRRDIYDDAAECRIGCALVDHPSGDKLREEVRAFEIDPNDAVEASLRRFQDIGAHRWRDAGVIHKHVKPAKSRANRIYDGLPICRNGDVATAIENASAATYERLDDARNSRGVAHAVDRQVEAAVGERFSDSKANAAAPAGHQRNAF